MPVAALVVSIAAVVVAVLAALYSRRAAIANEDVAKNDRDRRRAELTPRLRIFCEYANPGSEQFKLTVELVGPGSLLRYSAF